MQLFCIHFSLGRNIEFGHSMTLSSKKGPWDDGPWGKNKKPNDFDLDALFRKLKQQFGKGSGGGTPSLSPKLIITSIVILFFLWLSTGFYKLETYEEAIVLRFGKWIRTDGEGLNYHLPFPIEQIAKVQTGTIYRMDIGIPSSFKGEPKATEHIMLTGDENILHIGFSLSWQIKDLQQFALASQNPIDTLGVAAESVLREIIGQTPTAPIISRSGWVKINDDTKKRLQALVDSYKIGIRIGNVELHTALPPQPVADSFTEVQRAKTYQEQIVNEAHAYANDKVPRARGQFEKQIADATAFSNKMVNEAKGRAAKFEFMLQEINRDPDLNKLRIYYDTMMDIFKKNKAKTIFDPKATSGIVPYLPLTGKGKVEGN